MPPQPVANPDRRFVATRVDAGVETNLISSNPLPPNYTTDQVLRGQQYANVIAWLDANPGVHVRLYGPTDGGPHTDSDCIWDSTLNPGLPQL